MKCSCMVLTAALAFAVFGTATALAQPAKTEAEGETFHYEGELTFRLNDRQEEVEILRRLLDKGFAAVYGRPGQKYAIWVDSVTTGPGMPSPGMGNPWIDLGANGHEDHLGSDLAGVYLKDYGVVYTVTLPPPPNQMPPGATAEVVTRTPLSPWERTRKELRGEKIEDEGKGAVGSPSLSDVILKVLADNGKHFTRLADGERITVAVTFRDDAANGIYHPQLPYFPGTNIPQGGTLGSGPPGMPPGEPHPPLSMKPPSGAGGPDTEWVTTIRNGLTLANLHLKQQRYPEAIAAYQVAENQLLKELQIRKEKNPEDTGSFLTGAQLYLDLAKGYEAAGDKEAAKKAKDKVTTMLGMTATQMRELMGEASPPTPPALPSKLVVTASKKLLDEVGSGKMTFEAFRKAATVENVTPSAADKK